MKILLSLSILCLVFVPFFTSAQTEVLYPLLPGVVAPQDFVREAQDAREILPLFINYLFRLLLLVSLFVVFGVILYAGLLYLLSTNNPLKTKAAREWILSAIQGTVVIFSSYALLYTLDSQLVLFGLRNLERGEMVERVDLNWEIRNSYFQIPFGLLIEDAILNENAKNKLYDVLDATNEAEAVAEAIYQGSRQLLAIIESCPVGRPCGSGGAPVSNPPAPYNPPPPDERNTDNAYVPPTPEDSKAQENNQQLNDDILTIIFQDAIYEVLFKDPSNESEWSPVRDENHFEELKLRGTEIRYEKLNDLDASYIAPFISSVLNIFKTLLFYENNFIVSAQKPIAGFREININANAGTIHKNFNNKFVSGLVTTKGQWVEMRSITSPDQIARIGLSHGLSVNADGEALVFLYNPFDHLDLSALDLNDLLEGIELPEEEREEEGEEAGEGEEEAGEAGRREERERGERERGERERGERERGERDNRCPPCPDITPPVQAKIAEIEGYFPVFLRKLQALLETKEPIKEDLFQLYKAVMIKSLGREHLINYNSLLFYRRYYDKEEIVVRTAEERTEIGRYYWDWTQWLNNTLYRIKFDNRIIEENDPVTFYLRYPFAQKIVDDATQIALSAKKEGIQDAGHLIGVPRKMPPPPPDLDTTLYLPTNPEKTRITSPFGWRYDPFTRERVMHHGLDIAGPRHSPIYAAEKGEVVFAGWMGTNTTGYGKLIIIYHKASEINGLNSDVVTYYAHLEPNSFMVQRGDMVSRGQHIAGMGTTGRSTGFHLHFEVRESVRYPFALHTGIQVDPTPYINIDAYALDPSFLSARPSVFTDIFQYVGPQEVTAKTDMEILFEYLHQNNIRVEDLTEERLAEILNLLDITPNITPLLINPDARPASELMSCGMEIPVGEAFELTWDHLVELLDTIDHYISEGEILIQQQQQMNELARPCRCLCSGGNPPACGECSLTCNIGTVRAAHADVAKTRQKLREIAAHIKLLTDGHFNTPTEELCDALNEDIRDDGELVLCSNRGSKLITKHELITRKLHYSRYSFDECITRPEHIEEVLEGTRAGRIPFFGPIAEENDFKRYTKTIKNGFRVNTSDFNWFCCRDFEE